MKKVLALVLAVMMMATVAFAADYVLDDQPGSSINPKTVTVTIPGSKIKFNDSGILAENANNGSPINPADVKAINSTNYSMKVKWDENGKLVESVKFDDATDEVVIKIKQDYTLTTLKDLKGTITLTGKRVNGNKPKTLEVPINAKVGYVLADGKGGVPKITIDADNEANAVQATAASFVADFDDDDNEKYLWKVVGDGAKYGTLEFDAADEDINVEVRVYDGDKLYLYNDMDADTAILKAYADADADITFANFPGAPTFNATATVRFYKDEDSFIYGVKDGQLTNVNAKWDDDEGCFILKTRTLGSYVFSDKKLNVAATTTTNPDTGANDVVGIATALAAVALVSAAAVSLKK